MAISTNMIKFRDGPYDWNDQYPSEKEIRKLREEYDRLNYEKQRVQMLINTPLVSESLRELKEEKMPKSPTFSSVSQNRILLLCEV
jgi:hypothetical protein